MAGSAAARKRLPDLRIVACSGSRTPARLFSAKETIEVLGAHYHCRRNRNLDPRKTSRKSLLVEQVTHECQSARLAAERPRPHAQEKRIARLESRRVKIADRNFRLFAPVFIDRVDQVATKILERRKVRNLAGTQFLRQRKLCSRREPSREVIALAVERDAVGGNAVQLRFQRIHIAGARHLFSVRHAKDEVAKGALLDQQLPEISQERRRAFLQERETRPRCARALYSV